MSVATTADCRGRTDLFFSRQPDDVLAAVAICEDCPNAEPCRQGAQERGEDFGVWGGWIAPKGKMPAPRGRPLSPRRPRHKRRYTRPRVLVGHLPIDAKVRIREDQRLVAWTVTAMEPISDRVRISLAAAGVETSVVRYADDMIEIEAA